MGQPESATTSPLGPPQGVLSITQLCRDSSCCRSLNWRCDLPVGLDPVVLGDLFVKAGYHSRSQHPSLKVFRHPEGHELAWVVTTGRIQIRVATAVEVTAREQVARDLYQDLVELVCRSSRPAGGGETTYPSHEL